MALLPRALQKIFGLTGGASEFGKIGSKAAGAPATTKDLELMQTLSEYDLGLNAIVSDQGTSVLPYLEDINSLFFLTTSQLAYMMQSGVAEWNDATEYYQNISLVLKNGIVWKDIFGTPGTPNLNFEPSANLDKWKPVATTINVSSLVDVASITTDCALGSVFTVTLAGNRTLANPTNKVIGQTYVWVITQDGGGANSLSFDTDFDFLRGNLINLTAAAVSVIIGTVVASDSIRCEMYSDSMTLGKMTVDNIVIDGNTITNGVTLELVGGTGMTLNANELAIDADGIITKAKQPGVISRQTASQDDVTGNGAVYSVLFANEVLDRNNDFASPIFTGPKTGVYLITASLQISGMSAAMTKLDAAIVTSNNTYSIMKVDPNATKDSTGVITVNGAVLCDMDAFDTATIRLIISNGVGDTADIVAGASIGIWLMG